LFPIFEKTRDIEKSCRSEGGRDIGYNAHQFGYLYAPHHQ